MTTVTIRIVDDGDGVNIECDPSIEQLCERAKNPASLTSAEGYAMVALITFKRIADGDANADDGLPFLVRARRGREVH